MLFSHPEKNGFLPAHDPIPTLPKSFATWESYARDLPKLLANPTTREMLDNLPNFAVDDLKSEADFERAMLILSYLGHAYVWNMGDSIDTLPAVLAKPWCAVAQKIGRKPVLSYASYALYNWYRIDKQKPIALNNIALLQNFLGGIDEEWFILIHVDIEQKAQAAITTLPKIQEAIEKQDHPKIIEGVTILVESLTKMCETLDRMPEHCDPYIYFNRVRPYIHGWKDNPALPNGLIYEGEFENKPQKFKGETGAQSTIIPSFDAILGIEHQPSPLKTHLDEMRIYMPPAHRQFLEKLEQGPKVKSAAKNNPTIKELYNDCVNLIYRFRKTHLNYAANYIQKQSQVNLANPTEVGTGGTPFMRYLREHLEETLQQLI